MAPSLALRLMTIYVAGGIPLGILGDALPVHLRQAGVGLTFIGLVQAAQLPWSLKPLWAPWVDRVGTLRRWMVASVAGVATAVAALGYVDIPAGRAPMVLALGALTMAAATYDLAADATFIRAVPPGALGPANGLRVAAYRGGVILGGGALVAASASVGWPPAMAALAVVLLAAAAALSRLPTPSAGPTPPLETWVAGLWAWLKAPGGAGTFLFLLLFRFGDAMLGAVARPFWVDRGLSPATIGLAASGIGIGLTVVGALVGGAFTARAGIATGLGVLGLLQAGSNLGYTVVATWDLSASWLLGAIAVESFCQGLGTAALLALISRLCDPVHAATQFAVLTALGGLTRALASGGSGLLAERLGYASFFAASFATALPALALLPAVRRRLRACPPAP